MNAAGGFGGVAVLRPTLVVRLAQWGAPIAALRGEGWQRSATSQDVPFGTGCSTLPQGEMSVGTTPCAPLRSGSCIQRSCCSLFVSFLSKWFHYRDFLF